jgi:hypothetical protein
MNRTITVAMRVLVILGYLVGAADSEAMDGEAAARVSLVLAGVIVAAFLFYVALRDATVALLSKRGRRRLPGRRSLSSVRGKRAALDIALDLGPAAGGDQVATAAQAAGAYQAPPRP